MPRPARCAWTLLETVIAIGLGMLLALSATAAVRVAGQATTAGNRLSIGNALLRGAFHEALEELDTWTALDDPDLPPDRRHLHGVASDGRGLPFTPFARSMATSLGAASGEDDRGWDPDAGWKPNDPRTWWRGNQAERDISDQRFGRYAILADADAPPGGAPLIIDSPIAAYGPVVVPHRWQAAQMRSLIDALGFYGLCEYLPANSLCAWYERWSPTTNAGGIPLTLIRYPDLADPYRFNGTDNLRSPFGIDMATCCGGFAVVDPSRFLAPGTAIDQAGTDRLAVESRRYFAIGYNTQAGLVDQLREETEHAVDLVRPRPAHWPGVTWTIDRFVRIQHFTALCRVAWIDPVTGARGDLSFPACGTTLRGARQQRARDGGWARWDDAPGSVADPDLDAPPAPWAPRAHP